MNSTLFTAASRHFVKSVGAKTLHPVNDLNSAERFKPLCLITEKKSIWPWGKPKIASTEISLNDVINQEIPNFDQFITREKFIEGYKETPQYKIDGDIGSKLAGELSLDLSIQDTFSADMSFGDIMKDEVDWERLKRKLTKESFDMNHQLWQEVKSKKSTNVWIVTESLRTADESSLSVDVDEKEGASGAGDIPSTPKVDLHARGDIERKKHVSFDIPANTVLAYDCTMLAVNEGGGVRLLVQPKMSDVAPLQSTELDIGTLAQKELKTFKEAKEHKKIADCFLNLLSPKAIHGLFEIFAAAEVAATGHVAFWKKMSALTEEIGGDRNVLSQLLLSVGFEFSDDEAEVQFPQNVAQDLLQCCIALTESLLDFNESQLARLQECKSANEEKILSVLNAAITGKLPTGNAGLKAASKEALLLKSFGLELERSEHGAVFNKGVNYSEEAARHLYIAVHALFV